MPETETRTRLQAAIEAYRDATGKSPGRMSQDLKRNKNFIGDILSGKSGTPRGDNFFKLAAYLGKAPDDLLDAPDGAPPGDAISSAITELLRVFSEAIEERGWTEREACEKAGLNLDAISTIRDGEFPETYELSALAQVLQISQETVIRITNQVKEEINNSLIENDGDTEMAEAVLSIRELNIAAAAGTGTVIDGIGENTDHMTKFVWRVPQEAVFSGGAPGNGNLRIIRVVGDSMTPEFFPGERVMVNTVDRTPSPPGVFVVWEGLGLVLKRVELVSVKEPYRVRLISKNPDYVPQEYMLEDVNIQGRVVGRWQWT